MFAWCLTALSAGGISQAATIIKGPYLQNVTPSSIVVMWETDVAVDSRVDFGVAAPNEYYVYSPAAVSIHEVTLTGLPMNTKYFYTVTSAGTTSAVNTFWTAPDATVPYRFAAYGDTRTYPDAHAAVVQSIIHSDPDFVLHVGDYVANGRTYAEWEPQFFTRRRPDQKRALVSCIRQS